MKKIILSLLLCSVFSVPTNLFGTSLPNTTIEHPNITILTKDKRSTINAKLSDITGIIEARCYFKTSLDQRYLYTIMHKLSGTDDVYECNLPSFDIRVKFLKYFFLIVNGDGQAIRSTLFQAILTDATTSELPLPNDSLQPIKIFSELGKINQEDTSITDDNIELKYIQSEKDLHGLRAGIYKKEEIPKYFNVMSGYFGGFLYDFENKTIIPQKGFAPLMQQNMPEQERDSKALRSKQSNITSIKGGAINIAGHTWTGYFGRTDSGYRQYLEAVISQSGSYVTITTTKTGLGHYFEGMINTNGDMLVYDSYDGEDWSTHYGPATNTLIKLYDFIRPPTATDPNPPLNKLILYRAPQVPTGLSAQRTVGNNALVSWHPSSDTVAYAIYSCETYSINSCSYIGQSIDNLYLDARQLHGIFYYRVSACTSLSCSQLSDPVVYNACIPIPAVLQLLLH